MALSYATKHSKYYISLVEKILRELTPSSNAASSHNNWIYPQPRDEESTLLPVPRYQKSFAGLDLAMSMESLRRTANVRKQRAFAALVNHHVFQELPPHTQSAAGERLRSSLTKIYAEDCKMRLDKGWENHFQSLANASYFVPRRGTRIPWNRLVSEESVLREEASRLLRALNAVESDSRKSHSVLCAALQLWLDEHRSMSRSENTTLKELNEELATKAEHA